MMNEFAKGTQATKENQEHYIYYFDNSNILQEKILEKACEIRPTKWFGMKIIINNIFLEQKWKKKKAIKNFDEKLEFICF